MKSPIRRLSVTLALLIAGACRPIGGPPEGAVEPTHVLVFEGYLTTTPELLEYDLTTRVTRRLIAAGTFVTDPTPSPDGSRIAFVVGEPQNGTGDIYVMNRDGSSVKQLTFDAELDDQPTWSPDGTRIAFRSFQTQRDGDIWVMKSDGSGQVNLTPDPLPGTIDTRRPAWSPDGARIAYASNEAGTFDIWTMKPDGSDPRRLTSSVDLDTEPAWSNDSQAIAFRRSYFTGGSSDLFIVPAAGGDALAITLAGEQRLPVWMPGPARRLVFVGHTSVTARPDLFAVDEGGTNLQTLVSDGVPGGSVNPAFLRRP